MAKLKKAGPKYCIVINRNNMKVRIVIIPEGGVSEIKKNSPYEVILSEQYSKERLARNELFNLQTSPSVFKIFVNYKEGQVELLDLVFNKEDQFKKKKALDDRGFKEEHTFYSRESALEKYNSLIEAFKENE